MLHESIPQRWAGNTCLVVASGPSLTHEVAAQTRRGFPIIAVSDAWRRCPWAAILFATDAGWWEAHKGCPEFSGERWSTHSMDPSVPDDKREAAARYGLELVRGSPGDGFRFDGRGLHYGDCSGFCAINLALAFGAARVALVGFDLRAIGGRTHFFGSHPPPLREHGNYERFLPAFERGAASLPPHLVVLNATPGSALTCFPTCELT